jgi:hypothetical protein
LRKTRFEEDKWSKNPVLKVWQNNKKLTAKKTIAKQTVGSKKNIHMLCG